MCEIEVGSCAGGRRRVSTAHEAKKQHGSHNPNQLFSAALHARTAKEDVRVHLCEPGIRACMSVCDSVSVCVCVCGCVAVRQCVPSLPPVSCALTPG